MEETELSKIRAFHKTVEEEGLPESRCGWKRARQMQHAANLG